MGQCYAVYLKLKYDNEESLVVNSKKYIHDNDGHRINFGLNSYHEGNQLKTLDDILEVVITENYIKLDDENYESGFDASYGWEGVLEDWFRAIAPTLNDGSSIDVYPDEGSWKLYKVHGKLKEEVYE